MKTKVHALGVLVAVLGISGFFLFYQRGQLSQKGQSNRTEQVVIMQEPFPLIQTEQRIYTTTEVYTVPNDHQNAMSLSIAMKNNAISDVSLEHAVSSHRSQHHVDAFDEVYKDEVIGKTLSEANTVYVSGSTRTSDAFNRAIEKIQQQF